MDELIADHLHNDIVKDKYKEKTAIEDHLLLPKIVANLVNKDNVVSLGDRKSIRLRAERKSLKRIVSATSFDVISSMFHLDRVTLFPIFGVGRFCAELVSLLSRIIEK